jgi:amino acid adenylation domain-containing protein
MSHAYVLDQLLRAAAARWPDKVALESEESSLTYASLDAAADRIASALIDKGVGIGDRVGIHLEKSVEAVASLYGIMRAGAAYVPMDPSAPAVRTGYIATDCGVAALVSDPARIAALRDVDPAAAPGGIACGSPCPDGFTSWDEVQTRQPATPSRSVVDTDLAYILYTSGSTGNPKGVAISQRNSLMFVRWAHDAVGLEEADVLSSHAPLHFDLSTFDFFAAAAAGAKVSLVPPMAAMFPVGLTEWIRSRRITVWYSVPSALSMMVRYGELASRPLDSLRLVLFAGEVFPVRYLRELMQLVRQARYFNLYGPTETNVCTYYEVREIPAADDPPVPIGKACENSRCDVVDESGSVLTGLGAEGELVVTGSTVAQGYWGDPDRSAQSFRGPHTYATGDIVEILEDSPDPLYRFVGRRDHLVKSRGYRIELGEIEAVLYSHPAVDECVAVPVPDELMGNRIAAFCTVDRQTENEELTQACRERLPPYMVPDPIAIVAALPRTPNDKYDRPQLAKQAADMLGQGKGL